MKPAAIEEITKLDSIGRSLHLSLEQLSKYAKDQDLFLQAIKKVVDVMNANPDLVLAKPQAEIFRIYGEMLDELTK